MTGYLSLKFFHLLLFVYWLGGDLGTFYASSFVVNPALTPPQRVTALRIMMGVDMAPKVCMPFVLASGVHLAVIYGGIHLPPFVVAALWGCSLLWFGLVLAVHHYSGQALGPVLARYDYWLRVAVIVGAVCVALSYLLPDGLVSAPWIAAKLLIFSGTVVCGLVIRQRLKPFSGAFNRIVTQGPDEAADRVVAQVLLECRRLVYLIWAGLLIAAALGMHLL